MTARDNVPGASLSSMTESKGNERWKWMLCGVLFLATVLNYLDRQTIGLCKPKIMRDYGINNEQFGEVLAAFRWAYALSHIPAGFIADRLPLRLLFALAVGIWSLSGVAAFWARTLTLLKWTRASLGCGEAVNWPFSIRIISNLLPPRDRGLGMGIFNSGAALGALVAPLTIVPLANACGWRSAFLVTGGVGFLWVALWLWFTRGTRAAAFANASAGRPKMIFAPFRRILFHPGFWLLVLTSVSINPCWYFCCDWIPGYFQERSGFSFLHAGLLVTVVFLGGDCGNYLGGGLVKFLTRQNQSVRKSRSMVVIVGGLLASLIVLVPHIHNVAWIIIFLALAAIGINVIVPNQHACFADISFQDTAQVAGLAGFSANVFAAWANPRIGHYVDVTGHYNLIFYVVAVFCWIAVTTIIAVDQLRPETPPTM